MNAYQLADELQKMFVGEEYDRLVHEIPDLLRQQAKEIAMLKQIIDANNLQSDIGQLDTRSYLIGRYDGLRNLTDEEITEIGLAHGAFFTESKHHLWGDDLEIHDFARAILKKASDK